MTSTKQRRNATDRKFPFGNLSCSSAERPRHTPVHPFNKFANSFSSVGLYRTISTHQLLLWIAFIACSSGHNFGETSRPLNRGAIKDEVVQLNCSTQEPYNGYWQYKKPLEINWRLIYDVDKVVSDMTSQFSVNDSEKGRFNLIFNASESTSGRYACQPDITSTDQTAELTVLDKSPQCSATVTSGIVHANCSIGFSGNWAPKIVWYNKNERLETNDTITIPNHKVTSFLKGPFSQTDILTCTAMFVLEDKPHDTTAGNVPDLLSNCTPTTGSSSDVSSTQTTPTATISTATTTTTQPRPFYIIGIVFAFVIATVFIILFICKRKVILGEMCRKGSKKKGPSEAVPFSKKNGVASPERLPMA